MTELDRLRRLLKAAPRWRGEDTSIQVQQKQSRRTFDHTLRRWIDVSEIRWVHVANTGKRHAAASGALGELWPELLAVVATSQEVADTRHSWSTERTAAEEAQDAALDALDAKIRTILHAIEPPATASTALLVEASMGTNALLQERLPTERLATLVFPQPLTKKEIPAVRDFLRSIADIIGEFEGAPDEPGS